MARWNNLNIVIFILWMVHERGLVDSSHLECIKILCVVRKHVITMNVCFPLHISFIFWIHQLTILFFSSQSRTFSCRPNMRCSLISTPTSTIFLIKIHWIKDDNSQREEKRPKYAFHYHYGDLTALGKIWFRMIALSSIGSYHRKRIIIFDKN